MGEPDFDGFRCLDCEADFREPSFSEGPKTRDPVTEIESVRFKLSKYLCPDCLSQRIRPTKDGVDL